jgi:photosystem II cytochrome c550
MLTLNSELLKPMNKEFYSTCSQCHNGGRTKTNPNVTLGTEALANAYPARDNVESMVDYLKNPTTYDGEAEISEFHPNTNRPDLFPEMKNYTDEDLEAISGFVLSAQNIKPSWGRGKVYD